MRGSGWYDENSSENQACKEGIRLINPPNNLLEESMRIEKDNIVIRSANVDDDIQLNKWWNDGKVMEHSGFSK